MNVTLAIVITFGWKKLGWVGLNVPQAETTDKGKPVYIYIYYFSSLCFYGSWQPWKVLRDIIAESFSINLNKRKAFLYRITMGGKPGPQNNVAHRTCIGSFTCSVPLPLLEPCGRFWDREAKRQSHVIIMGNYIYWVNAHSGHNNVTSSHCDE